MPRARLLGVLRQLLHTVVLISYLCRLARRLQPSVQCLGWSLGEVMLV